MEAKTIAPKQGQTLIEVLITLLLISVSVIALIRFQNYLAYDNSFAQQKSEATLLVLKQIEILKEFQVLNNTAGYNSYDSITSGTQTIAGKNASYTVAWTVSSFTNPTYKNIDVTATWTDRINNSQSIRLITNIAGIDPANSSAIM